MAICPKAAWPGVKAMLHSVYDQPDTESVNAQYDKLLDTVADTLPEVHEHLDTARADILAFTVFPREICTGTSTGTSTGTRTGTSTSTGTRSGPKVSGRQPSEHAVDAAIEAASRLLRLPTMRDRYAEIADAAGREQLSYRAFLAELLLAECDDRTARRATRRVHEAGFPRPKTLEDFDFNANTAINPATINTLAGCSWIRTGQSLCLIGDSGTG